LSSKQWTQGLLGRDIGGIIVVSFFFFGGWNIGQILGRKQLEPQLLPASKYDEHHDSHHHDAPVKEGFGSFYWILFGSVPAVWLIHKYRQNPGNPITTWLGSYEELQEEFKARNALQARLEQQAADDRMLFSTSHARPPYRKVEVRSLENINAASPFNQSAGWTSIDLEKLIEEVDKQNLDREKDYLEARHAALLAELNREMQTKLEVKLARLTRKQKEELADQLVEAHEEEFAKRLKAIIGDGEEE